MKSRLAVLLLLASAPAGAETIDLAQAKAAIAERQALCDADQGRLWGKPLCGPILFADDASHRVVASQAGKSDALTPERGLFVGKLPSEIPVSNTATDWDGVRWSLLEWPLPEERQERDALLIHESWHRIQAELGLPARSPVAEHLARTEGRITLRLEWRALSAALLAPDEAARKAAIRDVLIFRQRRRAATRQAGGLENQLELNEGLAEYTGRKLSGQDAVAIAAALGRAEYKSSFVRSFAYSSGPAYGYLLDLYGADWRKRLNARSDLGVMLAKAAGVPPSKDIAREAVAAGRRYDVAAVAEEEDESERRHAEQAKRWTEALIKGPLLHLPLIKMQIQFNPSNLFPLSSHGTVYPTLQISDEWGTLKTGSGGLVDKSWSSVTLAAADRSAVTLKPGWSWHPGKREGDFVAARD